jgi:UDP-2-acetamido-2-deoxy-ribo-hexuluronate aminotransferase
MGPIHMVDLPGQFEGIKEEIYGSLEKIFSESRYINGPEVGEFARNLAEFLKADYVIPCGNGTDALQLALMALDLPRGSEVIVPSFNYVAAAEVLPLLGLVPVFIDSRAESFNLNEDLIAASITEKTSALLVVHLFGQACDMNKIIELAKKHGLRIIEDNAQSIGSTFTFKSGETKSLGTIGDIGTTSFFPSKNLGCYGDGGAVYTQDSSLEERIRMFGNHGQKIKYEYELIGLNSRLDTVQAGFLNVKLKRLKDYINSRQNAARFYDEQLQNIEGLETPFRSSNSSHVFHQYTLKIKGGKRDDLKRLLAEKGIPSMIYYPRPLHLNPAYSEFKKAELPVAEELSQEVLSIPMHTELTEEIQEYICEEIKGVLSRASF